MERVSKKPSIDELLALPILADKARLFEEAKAIFDAATENGDDTSYHLGNQFYKCRDELRLAITEAVRSKTISYNDAIELIAFFDMKSESEQAESYHDVMSQLFDGQSILLQSLKYYREDLHGRIIGEPFLMPYERVIPTKMFRTVAVAMVLADDSAEADLVHIPINRNPTSGRHVLYGVVVGDEAIEAYLAR